MRMRVEGTKAHGSLCSFLLERGGGGADRQIWHDVTLRLKRTYGVSVGEIPKHQGADTGSDCGWRPCGWLTDGGAGSGHDNPFLVSDNAAMPVFFLLPSVASDQKKGAASSGWFAFRSFLIKVVLVSAHAARSDNASPFFSRALPTAACPVASHSSLASFHARLNGVRSCLDNSDNSTASSTAAVRQYFVRCSILHSFDCLPNQCPQKRASVERFDAQADQVG